MLPALRRLVTERHGLLRLLMLAGGGRVAVLGLLLVVSALVPTALALVSGWLVGQVVAGQPHAIWAPVVLLALLLLVGHAAEVSTEPLGVSVARRIDGVVRARVRELTLAPAGLGHLEDPAVQNDLFRLWDAGGYHQAARTPGATAVGLLRLASWFLGPIGATVVLAGFSVPLAAGFLVSALWVRSLAQQQWGGFTRLVDSRVNLRRRVESWADLAVGPEMAKEVRLFGLGRWATEHRDREALSWAAPIWQLRRDLARRQVLPMLVSGAAAFAGLSMLGLAAASGEISAQALVTFLVAMWGVLAASQGWWESSDFAYGLGAVRALDRLHARYAPHDTAAPADDVAGRAPRTPPVVCFSGVSFTYPGASRPTLDGLDLTLGAGEVVAVVGRNGSGKTTMMKLLAGLYQPTSGRVLIDGTALHDHSDAQIRAWRRRLAVVYQDFVRYPASVADNIGLAAPEHLADAEAVAAMAERSGLLEHLGRLPEGLDTSLAHGSAGAMDLSGGQWQRLAIARAMFAVECGRQVLVLDEPTAHLDVRAEAAFFDQIVRDIHGVSIVLISHRLSTVRHADRIVFLQDGRITESGSHAQLLARGGEYARLFRLQAARFADVAEDA
ncbi:multidrug ABC transporter permease [Paractinoplanes rishiriensis]|uniref:Multidrug ABC transporter permease n=1 Tax=Paractinoplanes rishiriensis TaxID=1050105 RepID=A0A919MU17_9ACTN|nr:multidrug ABC transporter permease [Actinoplanes rishiriensis]